MTLRLGMIGQSPGNGHPFSFSAIINGFDDEAFGRAGWPDIHAYLRKRQASEFGFPSVRVTHAWTQDPGTTETLQRACLIDERVDHPADFRGKVDAVIIARDDHWTHFPMAIPLLKDGVPVFIDKPLTTRMDELEAFYPYLVDGRLFSCSALRYCSELDPWRSPSCELGVVERVDATVPKDWARYGVHALDAVLGLIGGRPATLHRPAGVGDRRVILTDDDSCIGIEPLGDDARDLSLSLQGARSLVRVKLTDNFSAFGRALNAFIAMVRTGVPSIPPEDVWASVATISAGVRAQPGGTPLLVPRPPAPQRPAAAPRTAAFGEKSRG